MKTILQLLPALLLAALSAPAQDYRLIDLGALIDPHSYALAINQRGQVAGYGRTEAGARAFLYSGGVITDLGPLGGTNSYGTSINLFGHVAGFSDMTNGSRAFIYRDGVVQRLERLAELDHYAFGINDAGWVVGHVALPAGEQAFVFNGTEVTLLGTLGGPDSSANAINSIGIVVGSSSLPGGGGRHAMLWNGSRLLDLNALIAAPNGWELEEARAINELGLITGWGVVDGKRRAFLFERGAITDLGALAPGRDSRGLGLNNAGEIVGTTEAGAKGEHHAFVWRNGQMQDLNDLIERNAGWELREARGINDGGQIVGWGSIRGQEHAFLLVPDAEAQAAQKKSGRKAGPGSVPPGGMTFFLASGGSSVSVTNSPLADAHVKGGSSSNSNFGLAALMELQTSATADDNRDVYFKFPIDNAPMPIGSAKLRVFTSLAANGSVITTTYSVADTNWIESGTGSITWSNRPSLDSALANATFNVKAGASYDIDVTSYVRAEQAAGRGIITLAFHCPNNTSPLANVSSDENGTAANRPVLVLNTNAFPTVSITSPANNASFPSPTNLAISASASDSDGTVTNVDFYAGAYLIGRDATSPFSFTWTNAPVGTYSLKAVAYDDFGAVGTSAVVNITITTNLVPLEDAHVKSDSPTVNFGLATQMEVQTNGASGPTRDAYLKFSLVGVTNISSAKIRIFAAKSSGSGSVSGTYFSVADTNWIEFGANSITWNNKPPRSNVLSHVSVSGTSLAWYTNDVTSFVQGESAAGRLLITLALHSQTNNSQFIKFNSGETNTPPELVITTTNSAPAVTITNPANDAVLVAPASFAVEAAGSDDGSVTQVEFFSGTTSLGIDTGSPYSVTWNNVPSGSYALTARATGVYGLVSTSAVVNINVDQRPTITLTAPSDGAYFPVSPTNITLSASAADGDGSVTNVEFFAGATSLGADTTSPYSFAWSSAAAGSYTLTARVADNLGLSSTSAPVSIIVDADTDGDGVSDHIETLLGRNPLVAGATNDVNGVINLRLFTPLK